MRSRQLTMNAESDLERTLSELGNEVAWPAAAGLSTRVAARVSTMPPYRRRWWSSAPRLAFATAAMLLVIAAGTLVWAPARETIADRLGLGDIEITSDHSLPPAGVELALGERVAAGDAAARAGFPVAPPLASLAGPDVYLLVIRGAPRSATPTDRRTRYRRSGTAASGCWSASSRAPRPTASSASYSAPEARSKSSMSAGSLVTGSRVNRTASSISHQTAASTRKRSGSPATS